MLLVLSNGRHFWLIMYDSFFHTHCEGYRVDLAVLFVAYCSLSES